jgi:pilus assembly protein Flp/PilA
MLATAQTRARNRLAVIKKRASDCHSKDLLEALMQDFLNRLWSEKQGQDIAEYAVMLAVILVIVIGTVQLIGSSANTVFSNVASSIQ